MADLSKPRETRDWINAWSEHGERGARYIRNAAQQMRTLLDGCECDRHFPPSWIPDEVRESVRLLEKAAGIV